MTIECPLRLRSSSLACHVTHTHTRINTQSFSILPLSQATENERAPNRLHLNFTQTNKQTKKKLCGWLWETDRLGCLCAKHGLRYASSQASLVRTHAITYAHACGSGHAHTHALASQVKNLMLQTNKQAHLLCEVQRGHIEENLGGLPGPRTGWWCRAARPGGAFGTHTNRHTHTRSYIHTHSTHTHTHLLCEVQRGHIEEDVRGLPGRGRGGGVERSVQEVPLVPELGLVNGCAKGKNVRERGGSASTNGGKLAEKHN